MSTAQPDTVSGTVQVSSAYFTAGLVVEHGKVIKAAPILGYMRGWSLEQVTAYSEKKDWRLAWLKRGYDILEVAGE